MLSLTLSLPHTHTHTPQQQAPMVSLKPLLQSFNATVTHNNNFWYPTLLLYSQFTNLQSNQMYYVHRNKQKLCFSRALKPSRWCYAAFCPYNELTDCEFTQCRLWTFVNPSCLHLISPWAFWGPLPATLTSSRYTAVTTWPMGVSWSCLSLSNCAKLLLRQDTAGYNNIHLIFFGWCMVELSGACGAHPWNEKVLVQCWLRW